MEGRMRKYNTSPERGKVWVEPSGKKNDTTSRRRVPVVYYLCRNRHLEHPHFIEVPLSSSPDDDGLYLKDVITRLNALRGRGMPSMYSWSCKRSYKNGFVWHDLSDDDLILPAHGTDYVLKGSEIFQQSHSDHLRPNSNVTKPHNPNQLQQQPPFRSQEASSSFSSIQKETRRSSPPEEVSPPIQRPESSNASPQSRDPSWGRSSTSLINHNAYKGDSAANASTQTDECVLAAKAQETCTRGVSTDDGSLELECTGHHQIQLQPRSMDSELLCRDEVSPPPSSSSTSSGGKAETLESLIRADVNKMNSFRILKEEELRVPPNTKLKPTNMLMQLISCGSVTVKDHSFGLIPSYRPRFSHSKFPSPLYSTSMMMGELDCLSENPRLMGLKFEDKEYFSGSLIETKTNKGVGESFSTLKRSSSYNADRTCKESDSAAEKEPVDSARSKCIPQSIKATLCKHLRNEPMKSPISERPRNSLGGGDASEPASLSVSSASSKRITELSSSKNPSKQLDSFREDKKKPVKIEERLASGARVIIQSKAPGEDREGSI